MNSLTEATHRHAHEAGDRLAVETAPACVEVTGDAGSPRPDWSIVIITRNEEANVEACLRSVVDGFAGRSFEVVLVDSASTDRTVEIASEFPVSIVCLPPSARLNPAVGRFFGYRQTRGSYVLFLDGDCSLEPEWVAGADDALRADDGLGGVAGSSFGLLGHDADGRPRYQDEYPHHDYEAPPFLAGSAAYKREALEKAGGFNPNLFSCEEEELGARVRKAGYTMRRLHVQMSQHHPVNAKETVAELLRRLRRRYFIGLGQLVRQVRTHELPIDHPTASIDRHLVYFGLMTVGAMSAVLGVAIASWAPVLLWLTGMLSLFGLFAARSGELRKPAYYFLEWTVASPAVVYGLLLRPHGPARLHDALHPERVIEASAGTNVATA